MCTVVCRFSPGAPIELLAIRDELASRDFDLPAAWWPEQPRVVGGRDRTAGGTWCASDIDSGRTAVVLNRPDRPRAEPGAASRGVLPLLAVNDREWADKIDLTPMASFNLVLAEPDALTWWAWDGTTLDERQLPKGRYMFTPRGLAEPLSDKRFSIGGAQLAYPRADTAAVWADWLPIITDRPPSDDPAGLLVRIPHGDDTYQTVFGQFIAARPGWLRLDHTRTPADANSWSTAVWTEWD